MPIRRRTAIAFQGAYYVLTGVWPLLSRRTFEAVTGPKRDWWLVQMVGLLAATNGIALAAGTRRERLDAETIALAALSAASFALIDTVYAARRRISPIYLGDALAEAVLLAAIAWGRPDGGNGKRD